MPLKSLKDKKMPRAAVYMDHAAATLLDPVVEKAMRPFWSEKFENPSALYAGGVAARAAVDSARKSIAGILQCTPGEIVFTPGGTASDNLAILGVAHSFAARSTVSNSRELATVEKGAMRKFRPHIIVSAIEHEAVHAPARQLEKEGFALTVVGVGSDGLVNPEDIKKALRPETILVSVMYANNEIGTIQPIREIAKIICAFRCQSRFSYEGMNGKRGSATKSGSSVVSRQYPLFHTDACQATNYLDLNVQSLGVDLMTLNGSKIYGPKMTGALYIRKGCELAPIVFGGGQERGLWSGTENVAGIVGFTKALEIAQQMKGSESKRLCILRDHFISKLKKEIPGVNLNGHDTNRLPNYVHISVRDMDGEALVLYLDARGIQAAIGSACTSQSVEPSHVLAAIGLSKKESGSSIRLTLGRATTKSDCDRTVEELKEITKLLR